MSARPAQPGLPGLSIGLIKLSLVNHSKLPTPVDLLGNDAPALCGVRR